MLTSVEIRTPGCFTSACGDSLAGSESGAVCSLRQIIDLLDVTLSEHPSLGFSTSGIDADTSASELFKQRAGGQGDAAVKS